jgi:hypothetical protein
VALEPDSGASRHALRRLFPWLLAVLSLLVSAAFVPYRVPPSDEGALLTQASRILQGAVFYRDLDAYPFPLAPYLLAGAMGVFGEHLAVSRWLAAVVFSAVVLGVYSIAVQLVAWRRAALVSLGLLSFKFLAWPGLTAFSYWDLSFAFACFAVALALVPITAPGVPDRSRLALAGACTGLALLAKQSVGIYLAGAVGLLLLLPGPLLGGHGSGRWRGLGAFGAGLMALVLPVLGYFALHGVLGSMLYSGLVRPFVGYLPTSGISPLVPLAWWEIGALAGPVAFPYMPEPLWRLLQFQRLPGPSLYPVYWLAVELFVRLLYSSLAVAGVAVGVHWLRGRRSGKRDPVLMAFAGLAAAVVLSAFPRADYPHVISVYPLVGLLLLVFWERSLGRSRLLPGPRMAAWIEATALVVVLTGVGALTARSHSYFTHPLELERASLLIDPTHDYVESVVRFIDDEVAEGEPIFVFGHEAQYYFLTDRYHPWRFVQLYPGQTGDDGGSELVETLEEMPPRVIIRGTRGIPGVPALESDAPVLDRWVKAHYLGEPRAFQRYPPPSGWPHHVLIRLLAPRDPSFVGARQAAGESRASQSRNRRAAPR